MFTLRNDTPDGLPGYALGDGSLVAPTAQRSWVSIYSPTPLQSLSVDGKPADFESELEQGSFASSLFVDIPQRESVTIVAQLSPGPVDAAELRLQPASIPTRVLDDTLADCPN